MALFFVLIQTAVRLADLKNLSYFPYKKKKKKRSEK